MEKPGNSKEKNFYFNKKKKETYKIKETFRRNPESTLNYFYLGLNYVSLFLLRNKLLKAIRSKKYIRKKK